MKKITESSSIYRHLEKMPIEQLLVHINDEDQKVPPAIKEVIISIVPLIRVIEEKMLVGGRLFYIGAGTSGRLGVLDASECPPTFGVPEGWIIGLIAGGDSALRRSIEHAEDDMEQAWKDLSEFDISESDVVVGIAASGTTPYVVHGLKDCRMNKIVTGCITCNPGSPITKHADHPIEVVVGPEFVTGSTRMKSGTAQKLILNMISTTAMIRLGRVLDNKMVDMQLSNDKLKDRGTRILMRHYGLSYEKARSILLHQGSVRKAMEVLSKGSPGSV